MIVKAIVMAGTNCRLLDLVAISFVLFLSSFLTVGIVGVTFGMYEVASEIFSLLTL
jgi:hypothetical protein